MMKRQRPDSRPARARAARWDCALVCVLLCALALPAAFAAAGKTARRKQMAPRSEGIGPGVVWKPSERASEELYKRSDRGESFASVMQSLGASREAVAFTKRLDEDNYGDAYAVLFRDHGKVDLIQVFYPHRANDNWQYFLVNGSPELVDVTDRGLLEQMEDVELPRNATYQSLLKPFPRLFVWEGDNVFISATRTREGGQQFTFDYHLNKTCHADWSGYVARVAITFDKSGRLRGAHLLQVGKDKRD